MNRFLAFTKKELLAQIRSGKLLFLGILFVLFGIMNPAVAKLTPWLLDMMADSLAQSGMNVTEVTVTALDSWVQFFKNIPMSLIAFVLLEGGIFTQEYQSGTLVLSLTKGLPRRTVVLSKATVLTVLWTAGYWLCFGITYGYNAYFWDNSVAQNLMFSVVCWWVLGLWVVGLTVLFSTLSNSSTGVFLGTGGVVLVSSLLGLLPKISKFMPTFLSDGNSLIYGLADAADYTTALIISGAMFIACFPISLVWFNKKQL
jgi:ABC-2 type transport system permease protein